MFLLNNFSLIDFIILAASFIIGGILHEYAHAYSAYKLGDVTQLINNRLNLNPANHIDPLGLIAIFIIGFGWMKPVAVTKDYFKNPDRGMALVAFAGPLTNIMLALAGSLLAHLIIIALLNFRLNISIDLLQLLFRSLLIFSQINLFLAFFNLIPIPPLDGSRILRLMLPLNLKLSLDSVEQFGGMILIFLIFFPLTRPIFSLPAQLANFILSITFPF